MKRGLLLSLVALAVLAALGAYEWRYSPEMQSHIDSVNLDLEKLSIHSSISNGLIDSIGTMTETSEVSSEIIETHYYVHTLRDEILAYKIKSTAERSNTVGVAMYAVIRCWKDEFPD